MRQTGISSLAFPSLAMVAVAACAHQAGAPPASVGSPPPPAAAAPARPPAPAAAALVPSHGLVAEAALHAGVMRRLAGAAPAPCAEQDLPAAAVRGREARSDDANLGRGLALEIPRGTVAAARSGEKDVAVYISYALDPSSEVGDGGYRVRILDRRSGVTRDASLGFAMLRPYVVFAAPALPMLDGDVLQIAADRRELDDASIMFPPVALKTKGEEKPDRLLRCPLASLYRDTDGDGATDIDEARLATDPRDDDTDGDGLPDGVDPAPLGAAPAAGAADEIWIAVMRQIVAETVPGEMIIVESVGPRLGLADVPIRVLQLTRAEREAYERLFGQRVTADVSVKLTGPDNAEVSVSFGWTGASYKAHREASGAWTFHETGSWVT